NIWRYPTNTGELHVFRHYKLRKRNHLYRHIIATFLVVKSLKMTTTLSQRPNFLGADSKEGLQIYLDPVSDLPIEDTADKHATCSYHKDWLSLGIQVMYDCPTDTSFHNENKNQDDYGDNIEAVFKDNTEDKVPDDSLNDEREDGEDCGRGYREYYGENYQGKSRKIEKAVNTVGHAY
ncbi:hypothetical protein B0O99DRAFT_708725, partial [Bisporella sp. PMI_857]